MANAVNVLSLFVDPKMHKHFRRWFFAAALDISVHINNDHVFRRHKTLADTRRRDEYTLVVNPSANIAVVGGDITALINAAANRYNVAFERKKILLQDLTSYFVALLEGGNMLSTSV